MINNCKKRFFTHFVVRYLHVEGVLPGEEAFNDFIKTPMSQHLTIKGVDDKTIDKEVGLAKHFLKSYVVKKEEIKWPV